MNPLERAARAKELLETGVFKEVHAEIRNELIAAIEACPTQDVERLQELTLSLQLHNRHRKKLERWVEDGKLEAKKAQQQDWIAKARQRLSR